MQSNTPNTNKSTLSRAGWAECTKILVPYGDTFYVYMSVTNILKITTLLLDFCDLFTEVTVPIQE